MIIKEKHASLGIMQCQQIIKYQSKNIQNKKIQRPENGN